VCEAYELGCDGVGETRIQGYPGVISIDQLITEN
jgi:hypothetical protein